MYISYDAYRVFYYVAQYRSFTKAAEQYFLAQTAITQQIQKLETSLGVQLIDRKTRPISLTPMGQVFLREARSILRRMDGAIQRTREASSGITGTLRIGYTKGYEHSDLPINMRRFPQSFPNVLVPCDRCDTDKLTAGLVNGEYDLIFYLGQHELDPGRGGGSPSAGESTTGSCAVRIPSSGQAYRFEARRFAR